MILSIIIPLYNEEKGIQKLLDILVPQINKETEIVIVNDGSTDSSLNVCRQYDRYDGIVIVDKPNGGVSSARNAGINEAKGEFIVFIDSDDYVGAHYISSLLSACINNADMVQFNYYHNIDNEYKKTQFISTTGFVEFNTYYMLLFNNYLNAVWNKIFRLQIIKDNSLSFNEDFTIGEDLLFILDYSRHSNSLYFCEEALYYYSIGFNGLTQTHIDKQLATDKIVRRKLIELADSNHLNIDQEAFGIRNLNMAFEAIGQLKVQGKKNRCIFSIFNSDDFLDCVKTAHFHPLKYRIKKFLIENRMYFIIGLIRKIKYSEFKTAD